MEPLAHTLVGACLSETGLKRTTPLAAATLLVAANLPDLDGACYLVSMDLAFGFRRGLTHGVLAMVLLPALLTGAMLLFDALVRRRRFPEAPPARAAVLFGLSLVGVLSHPFLDWLNTYGIRLLMPFSERWFYGDALFIVDPWLWVLLGAGFLARRFVPAGRRGQAAWASLLLAAVYIGSMVAGSRLAEARMRDLARRKGWDVEQLAALPRPADPLHRTVIVATPEEYHFLVVDWTRPLPPEAAPVAVLRVPVDRVVAAALASPGARGVSRWLRFPSYRVETRSDGSHRVTILDARFAVGQPDGFGVVGVVELDPELRPLGPEG